MMAREQLSPNFSLDEFLRSEVAARLGVDMTPGPAIRANLTRLCRDVLQPLRDHFKRPVIITSGYRPPELNQAIGGATHSAHMDGRAADFVVQGLPLMDVARWLSASDLPFDRVILEFGSWVHVAVPVKGNAAPHLAFTATRDNEHTVYALGLPPIEEAA